MSPKLIGKKLIIVGMFCIAWLAGSGCEPTPVPFTLEGEMVTHTPPALLVIQATPAPFHITTAVEVPLAAPDFRLMGLEGDTAVGAINVKGENQIVVVDVSTGQMQQISSAVGTISKWRASISARWIVWIESGRTATGKAQDRLMAYDRLLNRELVLYTGWPIGAPALSVDTVVWHDFRNLNPGNDADVFAYDLAMGKEYPVVTSTRNQALPRISGQWVIYLEEDTDLRAHHLTTDEDFLIGQVPAPADASAGSYHLIGGHYVAWVAQPPGAQLHIYDLQTRADRVEKGPTAFLHLWHNEGLVIFANKSFTVYSFADGCLLGTMDIPTLPGSLSAVYASSNRVVWEIREQNDLRKLYTAIFGP